MCDKPSLVSLTMPVVRLDARIATLKEGTLDVSNMGYCKLGGTEGRHPLNCRHLSRHHDRDVHHLISKMSMRHQNCDESRGQDGRLHSCTEIYCCIKIKRFVGFLLVKKLQNNLLHNRNLRENRLERHQAHCAQRCRYQTSGHFVRCSPPPHLSRRKRFETSRRRASS